MSEKDRLVGSWTKLGNEPCAADYAAHLRIEPNGLYFGTAEPPSQFTWWDGGTWRISAPGQLTLSTANDADVTYSYALDGDTLTIADSAGCRFSYRRSD